MDRAQATARTIHHAATHDETSNELAAAAQRFQQTLAFAEDQRPQERAPALLDALAILHTLPHSSMPDALRHIVIAGHDLPDEHAAMMTDVVLTHWPVMITGCGQDKASDAAKSVAETMINSALGRPEGYQEQLLCKLAGTALDLATPMFGDFLIAQITAPMMRPDCHDPAALINAAAMLTPLLPEPQQLGQLKMLYRLANEQSTHRLAALEALQAQSNYLPLTLANIDFLQTLNHNIYQLRLAQF